MTEPTVELVDPVREVVEVDREQRAVEVAEPRREVVEVVETGERVLYIVEPGAGLPPLRLADLVDVADSAPLDGDVLTWQAGLWLPAAGSGSPAAGVTPYRHDQLVPATLWHVQHNLGYDPAACYVVDGSGAQSWPDRVKVNDNEFTLDWGSVLATGSCLTR